MTVVRSPHAHARIRKVDVSGALARPGVVAAFTGEDLASEWAGGLPCAWPIPSTHWPEPFDTDPRMPTHWPLAKDKARFAGDGVAVVIADSREHAVDAAESVVVDWEPLEAALEIEAAAADGAPVIHEDLGDNRCYTWSLSGGDAGSLPRGGCARARAVRPSASRPERDRAARRDRPAGRVAGRVHHLVRDADPAHPAHDARADARDPRVEAPRDRTRRRRRLRLEAERLRGGGALPRGRAQARHAGEVDRGALRGVRRHHPRPRRDPGHRAGRDGGGKAARRPREAARRHGRVLPARVARHPAARRVPLRRRLRRRGLLRSSAPASSRTRRRPMRIAAPAVRRRRMRSSGRWTPSRIASARTRRRSGG